MNLRTALGRFRLVTLLEGISYLVLLFIAMPLKYMAGIPEAVRIVGSAHGALFVLFLLTMVAAAAEYNWRLLRLIKYFVLSLIPFANFWIERELAAKPANP